MKGDDCGKARAPAELGVVPPTIGVGFPEAQLSGGLVGEWWAYRVAGAVQWSVS
jgi:hypothetical protein